MRRTTTTPLEMEALAATHPRASRSECRRFFLTFGKKHASLHLGKYLKWRTEYATARETTNEDRCDNYYNDSESWNHATTVALRLSCETGTGGESDTEVSTTISSSSKEEEGSPIDCNRGETKVKMKRLLRLESQMKISRVQQLLSQECIDSLPKFLFVHQNIETGGFIRDSEGHRIVHVLPAMLDPGIPSGIYAMAIALYLEQLFRDDECEMEHGYEQVTVMLDVRPGWGWPNVQVLDMLTLIRQVTNQLCLLHPNRLHKCILFPIPRTAIAVWRTAFKPFLDPKVRQSIELVPGSGANLKAPPPNEKLSAHVPLAHLEFLEQHRLSCFRFC